MATQQNNNTNGGNTENPRPSHRSAVGYPAPSCGLVRHLAPRNNTRHRPAGRNAAGSQPTQVLVIGTDSDDD